MAERMPDELTPVIRVAHFYQFPKAMNGLEANRCGYTYAFHVIKNGKGHVKVAGKLYNVKKGDLVHFPPATAHAFYSEPEQPLSSDNIYCELWAPAPVTTDRHLEWNGARLNPDNMTTIRAEPAIANLPHHFPLQHRETMIASFEQMVRHHQRPHPYSPAIANSLLKAFVLELAQLAQAPLQTDYRIGQIADLIDRDASAGRHYEAWLAQSGLRKTQFHDLFKKATGLSPKAFWTRAIMKQAAAALRESNRSVTELADALGYSSIHHFTKQFTAHYGVSPSAFRQRRKE